MDVYQVKEEPKDESMKVEYSLPRFWHRCMANFVDFFIFLVLLLSLFFGVRAIVQNTSDYKKMSARERELQLESGLYVEVNNDLKDIVFYLNNYVSTYGREYDGVSSTGGKPQGKNGLSVAAINTFIAFSREKCSEERYQDLLVYYDQYRLKPTLDGVHYYLTDEDGNVVINPTLSTDSTKSKYYYEKVFTPFIDKICMPFFTSNVEEYRQINRKDFNLLVFLEIPVAYSVAGILTYYVPPLFFRRGRKTLGKALYHIGLIDNKRLLSPTVLRFTARFLIFFFLELWLSLFTFAIPYIISFSLMAFSKKKQGFPDYMLSLSEVDTSKANIYMDYVEAQLKNNLHGEAVKFNMEKPL